MLQIYVTVDRYGRRMEGCTAICISRVCRGLSNNTMGYIFKYSDVDGSTRPRASFSHSKSIDLIDEEGGIVKTYYSVRAASIDLKISDHKVYGVLRRRTKSGKTKEGYRFQYH